MKATTELIFFMVANLLYRQQRGSRLVKIDCHVHLIGISADSGGYASLKMRRSIPFQFLLRKQGLHKLTDPVSQDATYAENLAQALRNSELDMCVLLAFDQIYSESGDALPHRTWLYIPNDYVRNVAGQYPDCFLYGASVHPFRPDSLAELERVRADGAKLVKLLPNTQGFSPDNPRIFPFYQKAIELDLPLLFHCGFEHTIPAVNQQFGDPQRLIPALEMGVKVIIAHGGSSGRFHFKETFGNTLRLLQTYDNCYADNSAMTNYWRSKYMVSLFREAYLAKKYGVQCSKVASKFLHGSDYPIPVTPWAFARIIDRKHLKEIKRISNLFDLDLALKRAIGFDNQCFINAQKLLLS